MKKLKLAGVVLFFVISLFLIALSISVVIDELNWIRYSYIGKTMDLNFSRFIPYVIEHPNSFASEFKTLTVCIACIILNLCTLCYVLYKNNHHFRRYILYLKDCIIVYRRKKLNLKKEKIKAKLDKLNQENE